MPIPLQRLEKHAEGDAAPAMAGRRGSAKCRHGAPPVRRAPLDGRDIGQHRPVETGDGGCSGAGHGRGIGPAGDLPQVTIDQFVEHTFVFLQQCFQNIHSSQAGTGADAT